MASRSKSRRRGTIAPKGDNRWLVRVSLGLDPASGRRVRINKVVDGTRREADQVLTELLSRQDKGIPVPTGKRSLGQWVDEYAATWSGHLGPRSCDKGKEILRLYLPAALRVVPLARLSARLLQDHYLALLTAGKAPATVNLLHRILSARLTKAVELGYLARNPLDLVKPPKVSRRDYRVLSPDEAKAFLEELDGNRYGALWALLLLTGLRPGEALALRWDDLEGDRLRVRRALVRLSDGSWSFQETKTKKGRTVTLPATAARLLQRHRARQAELKLLVGPDYATHGLLFATEFGQPADWHNLVHRYFRPLLARLALRLKGHAVEGPSRQGLTLAEFRKAFEAYRERIKAALVATNLARLRPYDLRHSAASLLLAAGEHPKVVCEMLGHARIGLTLDTYSHLIPGLEGRAAERLEDVIQGTSKRAQEGA
jgi:integrase